MIALCGWRTGAPALLALLAQMIAPAPAAGAMVMVPLCGAVPGRVVPIRLPGRREAPGGGADCKICHIAMRKRGDGDHCGDGEEEPDAT